MPVLKNPKHERFAQELAKGKTQIEAYKIAGYKPDDGAAARLSGNVRVQSRLAELQERGAKRAEITVETITRQLAEDRDLAKEVKSASAAVSATMGLAKLHGLIREKHEHTGANGGPIKHDLSGIPDEKLAVLEAILGSNPNLGGSKSRNPAEGDEA